VLAESHLGPATSVCFRANLGDDTDRLFVAGYGLIVNGPSSTRSCRSRMPKAAARSLPGGFRATERRRVFTAHTRSDHARRSDPSRFSAVYDSGSARLALKKG
jgi:hypothetical protein